MAELKVFVSSTCYDLSLLRSQLRLFIKNLGYEPIMSDYEDILYDPRTHTHTSCVDEVKNCDVLVLIIGSRFGGKATLEALNRIDFEALKNESVSIESLKEKECLSVTQLEVLTAIENSIPVYTFIEKRVLHDHALYEKNKSSDIIEKIIFPSIEKQETAKYIFNFINFVRHRTRNNNIFAFEKGQDIEDILKKQNVTNICACIAYREQEDETLTHASPKFHAACGYKKIGHFTKCGYKFGRWYDMIWMEKMIGEHCRVPGTIKQEDNMNKKLMITNTYELIPSELNEKNKRFIINNDDVIYNFIEDDLEEYIANIY